MSVRTNQHIRGEAGYTNQPSLFILLWNVSVVRAVGAA